MVAPMLSSLTIFRPLRLFVLFRVPMLHRSRSRVIRARFFAARRRRRYSLVALALESPSRRRSGSYCGSCDTLVAGTTRSAPRSRCFVRERTLRCVGSSTIWDGLTPTIGRRLGRRLGCAYCHKQFEPADILGHLRLLHPFFAPAWSTPKPEPTAEQITLARRRRKAAIGAHFL